MALSTVFLALWGLCSFFASGYDGEAAGQWWATVAWFMLGGMVLSIVAAVAAAPTKPRP